MLEINQIAKSFSGRQVLDNINIKIPSGSFFALLGASGSGKSTLLKILAGIETQDKGSIVLNGRSLDKLLPQERPINTVFQSYALFPHLNVYENIAFGLRMKKKPSSEIRRRVEAILDLVQMSRHRDSAVSSLSGGEQQRIALARAVVNEPKVLLLDEPFSALDHRLRQTMQSEMSQLQRSLAMTFILVTHDQTEAFGLADKIALLNAGRIAQCATAKEMYEKPNSEFVARFIGETNMWRGEGGWFSVRPENIALNPIVSPKLKNADTQMRGIIKSRLYQGSVIDYEVFSDSFPHLLRVRHHTTKDGTHGADVHLGENVELGWSKVDIHFIPDEKSGMPL